MYRLLILLLTFVSTIGLTQPTNDLCSGATSVSDFGCFNGDNTGGDDDLISCHGCQSPNCGQHDEVWFSFVAGSTSEIYELTSSDLGFIEFLLYDNCGGTLMYSNCGATPLSGVVGSLTIGNTYYIAISSDVNNQGEFTMCLGTSLPVELFSFYGIKETERNTLLWTTFSESNNDYFLVERSEDGIEWDGLVKIDGAGNSNSVIDYKFYDTDPLGGVSYYRLRQTDFNGNYEYSDIISIKRIEKEKEIEKVTNLMGQEVDENYKGIIIVWYTNGDRIKTVNK